MNPLGAGLGIVHFEIQICIGYKLPTFWEYNSVEIIHQRVSICRFGARFRNVYFLIFIFILDISCQHLGNTCQLNLYTGIGYILLTIGGYMSVGGFLPQGPTVRGPTVQGPNCPGPNCPGAQLSGAQLSRGPTVRGPTVRHQKVDS